MRCEWGTEIKPDESSKARGARFSYKCKDCREISSFTTRLHIPRVCPKCSDEIDELLTEISNER